MAAHEFLELLATVLCVAALTTVVFQRLRQPVVLGYILAGLIVGPYVPIPLAADREMVATLSEVGVILLMFSLGLEFRLRELIRVGPGAALTAIVDCSVLIWLGFVTGRAFGWSVRECVFAGAIIAISSTTIIAKAFDEQGIRGGLRDFVVAVLIVEDLVAILLMAALTTMTTTAGLSALALTKSGARLFGFLAALLVVGLIVVPRAIRAITRLERPETTLVASIGICFATALLAREFGYSVALGAFIAGSLVAESGETKRVAHLIEPVRDMFGAIFFVSVGMSIDPHVIAEHWLAVAVFSLVVIVGKVLGVSVGAFLTGAGTRRSLQAGMSMAQIGEFSFIIAGLGRSLNATGDFLYPLAVAVSALTTLTTPFLIRASGPVASFVDRKLPRPLQTFAALYAGWVERLRAAPRESVARSAIRRLVKLLLLDAALLAAIAIGVTVYGDVAVASLTERLGRALPARWIVAALAIALAIPLGVGIVRVTRHLSMTLGEAALPKASVPPRSAGAMPLNDAHDDVSLAPRRALTLAIQLALLLLLGTPVLAVAQPFLHGPEAAIGLGLSLAAFGYALWRSATQLQGHVRGGAEMIVHALAARLDAAGGGAQDAAGGGAQDAAGGVVHNLASEGAQDAASKVAHAATSQDAQPATPVNRLLATLGDPAAVQLQRESRAVGSTLAALDLRGLTGATVLAIMRGERGVIVPTAREPLQQGDVLVLAGTHEAVEQAKHLLQGT